MSVTDPTALTAAAAARAIRDGDLTSEALVHACLERIAEHEGVIHAWQHLDDAAALREAVARDGTAPKGPLHGVPVGIKDIIDAADQPTGHGSPIYAGHQPTGDATCVARLRAAGAVIIGKTVTTEFALFHPGPTTNPHDPQRTPGGSSSGSAAAVADSMVPLALGTQTAASIVRPASFCGVFGFKPTFGAVPTDGVKTVSPSLDTVGVFARDTTDLGLALEVMAGRALGGAPGTAGVRVGFAPTPEWEQADPTTRDAITAVAAELDLPQVDLPDAFDGLVASQTTVMLAEAAQHLDPELQAHGDQLSETLRSLLASGAAVTHDTLHAAVDHGDRCRALLADVFADVDVLLVPSAIAEAPVGLAVTGDPVFGRIWTLLGTPSVAVPGLRGPAGLPLGVQVVAAPGADAVALAGAAWLAARL